MPSNDGVNLIRYSLNHEKKLVTNYAEVGSMLKVVALTYYPSFQNTYSVLEPGHRRKTFYASAGWRESDDIYHR
uniref:Uncharacterized protein n=1 Tax=Candidatus Methanogaster sp. ANME-2c ERB4 TaxID=2759911 RepID=A0A7G9YBV9_9EURY|nr:hypothetical protein OICIIDJB_00006 [Methanosarcinales archaeon ANME-2c ERB4]QNO43101.1 hypothetical protein MLBHKIFI_00006 [Methanosarcinales archaeon ANME-2c ERB4]QNO43283.1 hypothetical protein CFCDKGLG_00002 [Methanosarcinales archaeon ANME-2c ERB4]QNO45332.1 hypothetical protein MAODPDDD_00001 [Methanosarcinales archaeon ANME-2c ERB4]QNO45493.1 hypothetical protein PALFMHCA_00003 [Methanosarcinales archaeon ANME-2c ERB4]